MHGLGGLPPTAPPKPKCGWAGDTLESIVHQATYPKQTHNHDQNPTNKWAETSGTANVGPAFVRSESDQCGRNFGSGEERSASASATFCNNESDATMMTWASFESPPSLKTKTIDEDSTCHGGSTDKASMLDEVIDYLKQLQTQVHLMNTARNMAPQMMMPLGMQQQLQMSLLARMGMGVGLGMGMLDMGSMARATAPPSLSPQLIHPASVAAASPTFVPPPPFVVPQMMPSQSQAQTSPYCTFLGQPMNMDLYNKMAAIYQQQVNQTAQQTSSPLPSSHVQGDHKDT
ncbi:basic helix-loop-helix (bHLH) DNA-binding superfamily protein [Actinidia rufa]|uniref:Basic helix-loop-helix (BHLH) DNA-binding superfamily protein n=1 Tax=Actinidia rufa TaxID=165716 RepID=A0A7J0GAB0_9ERIC|nr:basic helix-loop-helix (bHLH) DNA-binding superfamily protein [Actinidia rufa]